MTGALRCYGFADGAADDGGRPPSTGFDVLVRTVESVLVLDALAAVHLVHGNAVADCAAQQEADDDAQGDKDGDEHLGRLAEPVELLADPAGVFSDRAHGTQLSRRISRMMTIRVPIPMYMWFSSVVVAGGPVPSRVPQGLPTTGSR
jgi:hypothetical protein